MPEFTIVVESYNLIEGQGPSRWLGSLNAARDAAKGRGEVVVADVYGTGDFKEMLARDFPDVRRVEALGLKYDEAKVRAALASESEMVIFLDGDCIPQPGWHEHLLAELRTGTAAAAGYTRYDAGFYGTLMTVMDFGFFFPLERQVVLCYAFNNVAFRRQTLLDSPIPDGSMRCHCYFHACQLERRGTPVMLIPAARAVHETPAFLRERTRRGFDLVVAAREDAALREHRWLKAGVLSAPLFYLQAVVLDWRRTLASWRELDIAWWQLPIALAAYPVMRLVDLAGILRAFVVAPSHEGWGGTAFGSREVKSPTG